MALVFLLTAFSIKLGITLRVARSTSIKTGIAPNWIIGLIVVGKVQAIVMTSSPGLILLLPSLGEVNAIKAARFALDPEFVSVAYRTPKNLENFLQNSSAK